VEFAEHSEGFGADEGDVAGEDEKMLWERRAREIEGGFEDLHGVAGAALLCLEDEVDAGGGDGGLDAIGLVTDDAEDIFHGDKRLCGGDDMEQKGAAADFMQNFRALAFEARAFARGHDGYCETRCFHGGYFLMAEGDEEGWLLRCTGA
jgi:hypothetical protein